MENEQQMGWVAWHGRLAHIIRATMGNNGPEFWRRAKDFWDEAYEQGMSPYGAVLAAEKKFPPEIDWSLEPKVRAKEK